MFDFESDNYQDHPLFHWLKELRRDFHRHPEIGFEETRTSAKIRQVLDELGVDVIETPGAPTGVVGLIKGGRTGPTIGLRADIDALPMKESSQASYASQSEGMMHSCGHDAHTAVLLGVARNLVNSGCMADVSGQVKLIFQPAEETLSGAKSMIAAGAMENPSVDAIAALHVSNQYTVGNIGLPSGYAYAAADWLSLRIRGRGAHAAAPHRGIDPIAAAVSLYQSFQTIVSRRLDPNETLVLSISKFLAGDAPNIMPDEAHLAGTLRYFKPKVQAMAKEQIQNLIAGLEKGFGVEVTLDYEEAVSPVYNDPGVVDLIRAAAAGIVGKDGIVEAESTTGSEDFSEYLKHARGAMFFLGSRDPESTERRPAHAPNFDIDERCLPLGVEIMTRVCLDFLGRTSNTA